MKWRIWIVMFGLLLPLFGNAADEETSSQSATVTNLVAAYNGESNAFTRYTAMARKADDEGYACVAALFRAAARAEQVHAAGLAMAIAIQGGEPHATISPPIMKSTADNLSLAIAGESYERDSLYPAFLDQAGKDQLPGAERMFRFARAAETEHAALYKQAAAQLDEWKSGPREFFVCPTCGKTVSALDFEHCPVCAAPKDKFERII